MSFKKRYGPYGGKKAEKCPQKVLEKKVKKLENGLKFRYGPSGKKVRKLKSVLKKRYDPSRKKFKG